MKKDLTTILPGILIFIFIFLDSNFPDSKCLLFGIYFLFPATFIFQGILSTDFKTMVMSFSLSLLAITLPILIWYTIPGIFDALINYLILGLISFFISTKIREKRIE